MSAPAPPVVLRWTPVQADLHDALAVYRQNMGPRAVIFTYVPAIAVLLFAFALVLVGELLIATAAVVGAVVFTVFAKRINTRAVWRNPGALPHPVEVDRLRGLLAHVLAGGVGPR